MTVRKPAPTTTDTGSVLPIRGERLKVSRDGRALIDGVTVEVEELLQAYLQQMDWDGTTAMPSSQRLEALGLDKLASSEGFIDHA